TE
ncbi:uracil-DNA glycosylase, partial [Vibrio parahaemolyticus V-223/04]